MFADGLCLLRSKHKQIIIEDETAGFWRHYLMVLVGDKTDYDACPVTADMLTIQEVFRQHREKNMLIQADTQ